MGIFWGPCEIKGVQKLKDWITTLPGIISLGSLELCLITLKQAANLLLATTALREFHNKAT
jgi:hypothetical protein